MAVPHPCDNFIPPFSDQMTFNNIPKTLVATSATTVHSLPPSATTVILLTLLDPLRIIARLNRAVICAAGLLVYLACPTVAQQLTQDEGWQRFRGPNGTGNLAKCDVPLPWGPRDVAWELSLPGIGNASPVFSGDVAFVSSADPNSGEQHLHAVDITSGLVKWHNKYPSRKYPIHARSSFASSTPCANDSAVFFCWANPESLMLVALGHDGSELWKKDLGSYVSQHGFGGSPVLFGQTLVLLNSQDAEDLPEGVAPGQSRVMAFDSLTGELLWETPRSTTRVCYGSPTLFTDPVAGPALLLSNSGDGLFALSLQTGEVLWNQNVFSKRCVSSPLVVGNLAIGTEGAGGGGNKLFAVSLSSPHAVQFQIDRAAAYVPTPVCLGDLLFLWNDTGIVSCMKLPTAEVLWSKRIGGNVSSSPVIAGDKLIGIAEDGTVTILSAASEFLEHGKVRLDEVCRATPALSEHFILLRTQSRLICVASPTASKP